MRHALSIGTPPFRNKIRIATPDKRPLSDQGKFRRLRVVHVSPMSRTRGGISTVVANYLASDLARFHDLAVIEGHCDGSWRQKFIAMAIAVFHSTLMALVRPPDLVHVHVGDFPSAYRKFLICLPFRLRRIPAVLHFHGANFTREFHAQPTFGRWIVRRFIRSFDHVICLSKAAQVDLMESFGVQRSTVIHNSVPLQQNRAGVRQPGEPLRLLFLGLIGDRKGVFELLDVVERLLNLGHKLELVIGGNGEIDALYRRLTQSPLREAVRFRGWIAGEARTTEFGLAHVFLLPSHAEGMPMAILEAMSHGLPIIATSVGGIPELVKDGENGILLAAGDRMALEAGIATLDADDVRRSAMGHVSHTIIRDDFSFKAHLQALQSIYRIAVARPDETSAKMST